MDKTEDFIGIICTFGDFQKIFHVLNTSHDSLKSTPEILLETKYALTLKCSLKVVNMLVHGTQAFSDHHQFETECSKTEINELLKIAAEILLKTIGAFPIIFQHCDENNGDIILRVREIVTLCLGVVEYESNENHIDILNTVFVFLLKMLNECIRDNQNMTTSQKSSYISCILELILCVSCTLFKPQNYNLISMDSLYDLINLLEFCDSKISAFIMLHIFPKITMFEKCDCKQNITLHIWKTICLIFKKNLKNENFVNVYVILCFLIDSTFVENSYSPSNIHIYTEDEFWDILQYGLADKHAFTRKRALYIFKKLLDFLVQTKTHVDIVDLDGSLFVWKQSSEYTTLWKNIVLLLEVLEENQVHVIKPVLGKFEDLIKSSVNTENEKVQLHPSWIVILFLRMLNHENKYIVRWGISHVLDANVFEWFCSEIKLFNTFFSTFLEVLNDPALYIRHEWTQPESISVKPDGMENFFVSFCTSSNSLEKKGILSRSPVHKNMRRYKFVKKGQFVKYLLECISKQSWSGAPLLYISSALSKIPKLPCLGKDDLIVIRAIVSHAQHTQEPVLRGAIQCCLLDAVMHLLDWKRISFVDLSTFLIAFKSDECLCRNSAQWNTFCSTLNKNIFTENATNFSVEVIQKFSMACLNKILGVDNKNSDFEDLVACGTEAIARILTVFVDSTSGSLSACPCDTSRHIKIAEWLNLLSPVIDVLITAPQRPYLEKNKYHAALKFYLALLKESQSWDNKTTNPFRQDLLDKLIDCPQFIECNFSCVFCPIEEIENLCELKNHIDVLYVLSSEKKSGLYLICNMPSLILHCKSIMEHYEVHIENILLQFWRGLNWICRFLSTNIVYVSYVVDILKPLISDVISQELLIKTPYKPKFISDNISKSEWLKNVNESVIDSWSIATFYAQHFSLLPEVMLSLAQQAVQSFDIGPRNAVPSILHCLKFLLPQILEKEEDLIPVILNAAWKASTELQRSDVYRPALQAFIDMVFQPVLLSEGVISFIDEYMKKFEKLGESSLGIFSLLVNHVCKIFTLSDIHKFQTQFTSFFVSALTFGSIYRKDQRATIEAFEYVAGKGDLLAVNQIVQCTDKSDSAVRVTAIHFLLTHLKAANRADEILVLNIINALLDLDEEISTSRTVRFSNSYPHRVKTRIWQSILILQLFLQEGGSYIVLEKALEFLSNENLQPSVRYLQEWVVVKTLHLYPKFIEHFFKFVQQATRRNPGCVISTLAIFIHLIGNVMKNEDMLMKWIPYILSYCTAQNFLTRVYAHVAVEKLWNFSKKQNFANILAKYDYFSLLLEPLKAGTETKNTAKNFQRISSSFYFTTFDPIGHFTLETVFYELPRLSSLTSQEWIHPSVFAQKFSLENVEVPVSIFNSDQQLSAHMPDSWAPKVESDSTVNEEDAVELTNFQKKIMPWKQMMLDVSDFEVDIKTRRKLDVEEGLIVVASLIDRLPNLGGLCRTCEVFGVSEYVIGCLKYAQDKQFQNLSVTSDKWVKIKEVKPYHVKEYLLEMQLKGYTLIGAEQTEDSCLLTDYVFPKKSLLLLGNEKEGLPVDLIQLLDVCVEIPQQGIVRSLNVHVSGAILIWEYARQHQLKHIKIP